MRKQVLVTADRGETRVAILEAEGTPPAEAGNNSKNRSAARADNDNRQHQLARRRALHRAARLALDRRQRLQGQGRQRPARPRGRVRGHRPGEERLPARRRRGHPRRRGGPPRAHRRQGQAHLRAAQARPGDPGPGHQGPAEDQGPAPVDAALDRRPLPGLRAPGRGHRRLAPPRRQGARPAAQGLQGPGARRGRGHHPHRRPGRQEGRLRARDQVPAQAARGADPALRGGHRPGHGLPGGRPVGARGARHLLEAVRAGDRGRPRPAPAAAVVLLAAPRPSCWSAWSCTRSPGRRCSSATASTARSAPRCASAWTCPRAAT